MSQSSFQLDARFLAAEKLDEPDLSARQSLSEEAATDGFMSRMSAIGISQDIISRVSQRFDEADRVQSKKFSSGINSWEEAEEDDVSDDDEDLTLTHRAVADDKVFEVMIVRHESTGSLGLELDEYKGRPTVCAIMLGGPADAEGTLQIGDKVVAIDGKPTHNMEDVKRAVISAPSASLRLAVLRTPVVVMRRETAYMNLDNEDSDDVEWQKYEITLYSNRQLTFEKLAPPFVFGAIELPAAKSLRLIKVGYNVCLQIGTLERSYEFYTDSLQSLYEWQRLLRTLMLSHSFSAMSGWLTLISTSSSDQLLKRWWFDLCGSTHELCYYETDQCQTMNLPAQGCLDMSDATVISIIPKGDLRRHIEQRRPIDGSELFEYVRLMCDVHRDDERTPLGLELDADYRIAGFSKGSPVDIASGLGGHLKLGDVVTAVDGYEVTHMARSRTDVPGRHPHRRPQPEAQRQCHPHLQVQRQHHPHPHPNSGDAWLEPAPARKGGQEAAHGARQAPEASTHLHRRTLGAGGHVELGRGADQSQRRTLDHVPNLRRRGATDDGGVRERAR